VRTWFVWLAPEEQKTGRVRGRVSLLSWWHSVCGWVPEFTLRGHHDNSMLQRQHSSGTCIGLQGQGLVLLQVQIRLPLLAESD
jgi:hypothetical protein